MAEVIDNHNGDNSSQNAFSFKITSKVAKKVVTTKPKDFDKEEIHVLGEDEEQNGEIEYINDETDLKTRKKKEPKKLVIPMIAKNKWQNQPIDGESDNLTKEALNEIMNDLNSDDSDDNNDKTAAIPLMMKNRLPQAKEGVVMDEKYDISLRPEESTMEDYNSIPVTSFGSAMLRGMGWSEKKAIGGINKAAVAPVEYIPRHKGLGLGAEKGKDTKQKNRKRKLGEPKESKDRNKPIVDSDGRVRHTRRIGEDEEPDDSKDFKPDNYVLILKKQHKDLYGKIISVDEDFAKVSVKLLISGDVVNISQYHSQVVDKSETKNENFPNLSKNTSNKKDDNTNTKNENRKSEEKGYDIETSSSSRNKRWLHPGIRVRVISTSFKKGRYYNKKVRILDVTSFDSCTCKTEEGKILDDVSVEYLETIIPKSKGSYILIVNGKYKGKHAKLLERRKSEGVATVQLISNKHVTSVSFDDISEFVGELPEDEFL